MTTEEMRKSSESPSTPLPTSFSSLPYDLALNCLARISRVYHPTLSLVSKSFRSLITSSELDATRSRIGKTENRLYVCLDLNKNNPNPSWFALTRIPKQKLIQIPSFPYQYPESTTVVSIGTEIYIIGGFVKGKRSRRVLILDCRSHQWRRLPNLRVARIKADADVIDGKIYVTGGCKDNNSENWGEFYDPKTQKWEPLSVETLVLTIQKSVVPGSLKLDLDTDICLVEIEKNVWCHLMISASSGVLIWRDSNGASEWRRVNGVEGLSPNPYFPRNLASVVNSGGRRVTVWWKSVVSLRKGPEIWCAEVSLERRGLGELWGVVDWSKSLFTLGGCDSRPDFLLHSAIVTH